MLNSLNYLMASN